MDASWKVHVKVIASSNFKGWKQPDVSNFLGYGYGGELQHPSPVYSVTEQGVLHSVLKHPILSYFIPLKILNSLYFKIN